MYVAYLNSIPALKKKTGRMKAFKVTISPIYTDSLAIVVFITIKMLDLRIRTRKDALP